MSNSKRKANKKKNIEEKKMLNEEHAKKLKEKAKREEEANATKKIEEERTKELDGKLKVVGNFRYTIAIFCAVCIAFVAGFLYNLYCSGGKAFDETIPYFDDVEQEWHLFNGKYVRMHIDTAFSWYDGTTVDEATGKNVMTGTSASCLVWLDSENFISVTVNSKEEFDLLNEIIEESEEFISHVNPETGIVDETYSGKDRKDIYLDGKLKNLASGKSSIYNEAYEKLVASWGVDKGEYYLYNLTLDTSENNKLIKGSSIAYIIGIVVSLIVTIFVKIKYDAYIKKNNIVLDEE